MGIHAPLFPALDSYVVDLANPARMGQAANIYAGLIDMILAALFLGIRINGQSYPMIRPILAWHFGHTSF